MPCPPLPWKMKKSPTISLSPIGEGRGIGKMLIEKEMVGPEGLEPPTKRL